MRELRISRVFFFFPFFPLHGSALRLTKKLRIPMLSALLVWATWTSDPRGLLSPLKIDKPVSDGFFPLRSRLLPRGSLVVQ